MKHAKGRRGTKQRPRGGGRPGYRPRGSSLDMAGRVGLPVIVCTAVLIILFAGPSSPGHAGGPIPESAVPSPTPINTVDPSSGKPVVEGINSVYKGYTIAHCCENTRVTWEDLPEKKKDASIRRFLRAS